MHTLKMVVLFILYLSGITLYWLMRADYAVKSQTTDLKTKREWLKYYSVPLACAFLGEWLLFYLWANSPVSLFTVVNSFAGTNVSIPLNWGTAPVAGWCAHPAVTWATDHLGQKFPMLSILTKAAPVIPEVKKVLDTAVLEGSGKPAPEDRGKPAPPAEPSPVQDVPPKGE